MKLIQARGNAIEDFLEDLVYLRTKIFREWPYLYEAEREGEVKYLRLLTQSKNSLVVLLLDQGRVVGAATALPLEDSEDFFRKTFQEKGYNPSEFFYLSEVMLEKPFRGRRVLFEMYELLEKHRKAVFPDRKKCFCKIERDHKKSRNLSIPRFLKKYGYTRHPELTAMAQWREIGKKREEEHQLVFYLSE